MSRSASLTTMWTLRTLSIVLFLVAATPTSANERWSRQLTGEASGDWVPLQSNSPNKRQASARVLAQPAPFQTSFFPAETYPQDFLPQEAPRQLFLHSAPSGQQTYLNQQNLNQQPLILNNQQVQYNPLAQAFPASSPSGLQFNNLHQSIQAQFHQPQAVSAQYIQHPSQINNQFYNQINSNAQEVANNGNIVPPQQQQRPLKQESLRFVDGYKAENVSEIEYQNSNSKKKTILSTNKSKLELVSKPVQYNTQKATERSSTTRLASTTPAITTVEKEEVELLYVPLETLQNERFNVNQFLKNSQKQEALRDSIGSPGQINNQLYNPTTPNYNQRQQTQLHNIQQDLIQQAFNTQTLQGKFMQNQFERQPKYQQPSSPSALPFTQAYPTPVITTPKSKKLKAHQPPLAIYMVKGQSKPKLNDVLGVLKDAKTVSVLDAFAPNSPKIFIGPSTLRAPDNYVKFELPYLSSIEGNRIQRKVEQLPFFVAPLSYKAPNGFARIPFPSPHVGSVIVNPFMMEPQDLRPTPLTDTNPSSFSYSSFQNNPSTESFRTSSLAPAPQKQNPFNFFSSATPNPVVSQQSTLSNYQSSFLPYDPSSLNTFRPLPSSTSRKPQTNAPSSSRPPLSAYYTTPPASKPTVSYFSFPGSDYSTTVPTTNKAPNAYSYDNRGHYITNAAIETSAPPSKSTTPIRDYTTEKIQTTTSLRTPQKYQPHNPFSINQAFELRNPYEPTGIQSSIRANEVRNYNQDPVQITNAPNFNSFSQPPPKFSEVVNNNQRPALENVQFSTVSDYSPRPYFEESAPETEAPAQISNIYQTNDNSDTYSQNYNQYPIPSIAAGVQQNVPETQYHIENPTTNEITTPSTTTTTTTTTFAPSTRAPITGKPIVRGRPRYTTQRPENTEPTKATTRRTPIRERRPNNNFRAKLESSKTSTTTESSGDNMSSFESSKKNKESNRDTGKLSNRHQSHRYNKPQDEESKSTTESSTTKSSLPTRNSRIRSRGRTHFKSSDNYEGSDYVSKKAASKDEGKSIAYQRDVLHQNYPVTLTERMSTVEVHTSTPMPSQSEINQAKIRIYETTGVTQRGSYSHDDARPSESSLEFYENQPIFQGEQEKFLTQPEPYVEINNGNGGSTPSIDQYSVSQESSTENAASSTRSGLKKVSQAVSQEYFNVENNYENPKPEKNLNVEIVKQDYESTLAPAEYSSEAAVTDSPIAKFRSKLRSRPKHLSAANVPKQSDAESRANIKESSPPKKVDESQETVGFTRRSSLVQPVTYRPAFDRRRTTMRIEDIEADLKSSRLNVKSDSHSTTFKYPVYIPESTSASPSAVSEPKEENEVTSTTKRSHFARRRPVRPTSAPGAVASPRTRATTTHRPAIISADDGSNKRVRVRGRLRTRPTTTEKAETVAAFQEQQPSGTLSSQDLVDEKYVSSTQRSSLQKYSTRGRQATQKYSRRPSSSTERNSAEEAEDQASYDSINRPEYVEFNSEHSKSEYNPENGKSESQWSPKLALNSFRPIFNPNLIADDIKTEGVEYGTKLPYSEMNTEQTDIITAGNPYEGDVLIAVTPSSNRFNSKPSSVLNTEIPATPEIEVLTADSFRNDKSIDTTSTFESVLEEVMRNLEQQDEDEYNSDYKSVMKHEGGEIGEIPPEPILEDELTKEFKELEKSYISEDEEVERIQSYGPVVNNQRVRVAEERSFSAIPDVKFQTSTTERQPRRRGVWRRIKVRPTNKDVLQGAESQFYRNSGNDLVNEQESAKEIMKERTKPTQEPQQTVEETTEQEATTQQVPQVDVEDVVQTTEANIKDEEVVTENVSTNLGEMDLGIGSPESMMGLFGMDTTFPPQSSEISEDTTEAVTDLSIVDNEKDEENDVKTTVGSFIDEAVKNLDDLKTNYTQTTMGAEITEDEMMTTTLQTNFEDLTEKSEVKEVMNEEKAITNVLEKILTDIEESQEVSKDTQKVESLKSDDKVKNEVPKFQFLPTMPPGVNFDPNSVISTSMSTEISHETEICYRGRCVKTKKQDHKVNKEE